MSPQESFNPNQKKDDSEKKSESSWLGRNARKIITGTALGIASLAPLESNAQKTYSENDTTLHPRKEWTYDARDADFASHASKKYPGFVEHFARNVYKGSTDTTAYRFTGYMTEDEDLIVTPEETKMKVSKKEAELAFYSNPKEWAKQEFEFQKTRGFRKKVEQETLKDIDSKIEEYEFKISESDTNRTESFMEGTMERKGTSDTYTFGKDMKPVEVKTTDEIRNLKKAREKYLNNTDGVLDKTVTEKTETYEQLVDQAKFKYEQLTKEIKDLNNEYQTTLKYIADHTPKK